jgi:hypothetical protein
MGDTMTKFYPTWEEAERNRNRNLGAKHPDAEEVAMGDNGHGVQMYYVRKVNETNYTVVVTLEADMPTAPMSFGTNRTGADSAARMATAILAGTGEPQPLRPTHEDYRTVYRASGFHDVFGEWSVDLIAYDRGEICATCGEWFTDSDAWGEHNDMAHY